MRSGIGGLRGYRQEPTAASASLAPLNVFSLPDLTSLSVERSLPACLTHLRGWTVRRALLTGWSRRFKLEDAAGDGHVSTEFAPACTVVYGFNFGTSAKTGRQRIKKALYPSTCIFLPCRCRLKAHSGSQNQNSPGVFSAHPFTCLPQLHQDAVELPPGPRGEPGPLALSPAWPFSQRTPKFKSTGGQIPGSADLQIVLKPDSHFPPGGVLRGGVYTYPIWGPADTNLTCGRGFTIGFETRLSLSPGGGAGVGVGVWIYT